MVKLERENNSDGRNATFGLEGLLYYYREERIRTGFLKLVLWFSRHIKSFLPRKMARMLSRLRNKLQPYKGELIFFFDWYQRRYDIAEVGNRKKSMLMHYAKGGEAKGCRPNPFFDPAYYRSTNMDLKDRYTTLGHFHTHGCTSLLIPHSAWDEEGYLEANDDVKQLVANGTWTSGYIHFCAIGYQEIIDGAGLRCLPVITKGKKYYFVESWYLRDHPDVAEKVERGQFDSGLEHFFLEGHVELESGNRAHLYTSASTEIIRANETRQTADGQDLVVFAHYDPDGIVDEYVFTFLNALRKNDCDIVFVTAEMRQEDEVRLRQFCRRIYIKNGSGRDFAAWALAVKDLGREFLDEYNYTILANDSVYWPVNPDDVVFSRMREAKYSFWGIVDSEQIAYHLQSWFLAFSASKGRAVLDRFVEKFMGSYDLPKGAQIYEYEVWFTQQAMREGLEIGCFCPVNDLKKRIMNKMGSASRLHNRHEGNPSIDAWYALLSEFKCPALKVQLLREDPASSDYIMKWHTFVQPEAIPLISNHLRRVGTQVEGLPLPD